jgi:predicted PurR-regulated permease PerM
MFGELELGPRQRATVAAAMTLGAALLLLLALSIAVWGLARFVGAFHPVLLPPVVALILTMLLRPAYDGLLRVCRGSHAAALPLFLLAALLPLIALLWFAGHFAVGQLLRLVEELPALLGSIQDAARTHWPQVMALLERYGLLEEISPWLENPIAQVTEILRGSGSRVSQAALDFFETVAGLLAWATLPVYLVFFLMATPFEARRIGEHLPFLKAETREDVVYLIEQFFGILLTFFRGQILIALAQGALFAIGFQLVGLPYGILMGMSLGLLNVIPYLGSIVGLGVAIPLAWFGTDGGLLQVGLVLGVFTVVQLIEGYLLTPRIMGNRTGLHPALIIFAVLFWGVALNGILGMMLAIPLTAFAVVFWRLLKKKYIPEVV